MFIAGKQDTFQLLKHSRESENLSQQSGGRGRKVKLFVSQNLEWFKLGKLLLLKAEIERRDQKQKHLFKVCLRSNVTTGTAHSLLPPCCPGRGLGSSHTHSCRNIRESPCAAKCDPSDLPRLLGPRRLKKVINASGKRWGYSLENLAVPRENLQILISGHPGTRSPRQRDRGKEGQMREGKGGRKGGKEERKETVRDYLHWTHLNPAPIHFTGLVYPSSI